MFWNSTFIPKLNSSQILVKLKSKVRESYLLPLLTNGWRTCFSILSSFLKHTAPGKIKEHKDYLFTRNPSIPKSMASILAKYNKTVVCVWSCMCLCVHSQRFMAGVFLCCSWPWILRQDLLLNLGTGTIELSRWADHQALGASCSCLSNTGVTNRWHHSHFLHGCEGFQLRSLRWTAST